MPNHPIDQTDSIDEYELYARTMMEIIRLVPLERIPGFDVTAPCSAHQHDEPSGVLRALYACKTSASVVDFYEKFRSDPTLYRLKVSPNLTGRKRHLVPVDSFLAAVRACRRSLIEFDLDFGHEFPSGKKDHSHSGAAK